MAYSQIETRGQFVRLLGLGASGRNLTRRWEKNPTDAGAQRPGAVSLRRMLYLVVWQMTGILYIPHFPYQPCRACRNQQQNYPL